MRLQICGDVGEIGVGGRVRFVEAVAGELGHQLEEFFGLLCVEALLFRAAGEALALLVHLLHFLFAHGAAEEVGFAQRVSGDEICYLHHLFLIDDYAVGFGEDLGEDREFVADFLAAVFAVDEIVNHAAFNGAGAVESVEGAEIFDAGGLVFAQNVAHAPRFKLEDAAGEAFGEYLVGLFVVQLEVFDYDLDAAVLFDQLEGVGDDGQRGEAEEVHLEKAKLLHAGHVVLGDDFIPVGAVKGNEFFQRRWRDDDAGRVDRCVAGHAFQAAGYVQDFFEARISMLGLLKARLHFEGIFQLDVEDGGDELGDALDFANLHVEGAADVFDCGAGAHGAEGDDLRYLFAAVFFGDVLDYLAAAVGAEIDVDIGHADALRVEEALKEQAVFERIDVGDLHRVADQASGGGTAAGAYGNAAVFCVADEIPDDQEVAGELHGLDGFDFTVETFGVFGEIVFEVAVELMGFEAHAPFFEAVAGHVFEVTIDGLAGRNVEFWKRIGDGIELDVAALGDVEGAGKGAGNFAEEPLHFGLRFDVELLRGELHAIRIRHGFAGLDAEHDFVRAGIVLAEVVRIVGGDERDAGVGGEAVEERVDYFVLVELVVLHFEEEVVLAEDVCVLVGEAAGVFVFIGDQGFVDVAAEAGGEGDDAFGVRGQQVLVDAGFVIEAVEVAGGDEVDQVAVAVLVFAEQNEVVIAVGFRANLVALLRDVDFAADDGVDAFVFGCVVEFDGAEEVAVVGHGDGGHFLFDDQVHELGDFAGSV